MVDEKPKDEKPKMGQIIPAIEAGVASLNEAFKLGNGVEIAGNNNFSVTVHNLGGIDFMVSRAKVINAAQYMGDMTNAQLKYVLNSDKTILSCAFLGSGALKGIGTLPNAMRLFRTNHFRQAVIFPGSDAGTVERVAQFVTGMFGRDRVKVYLRPADGIDWLRTQVNQINSQ